MTLKLAIYIYTPATPDTSNAFSLKCSWEFQGKFWRILMNGEVDLVNRNLGTFHTMCLKWFNPWKKMGDWIKRGNFSEGRERARNLRMMVWGHLQWSIFFLTSTVNWYHNFAWNFSWQPAKSFHEMSKMSLAQIWVRRIPKLKKPV